MGSLTKVGTRYGLPSWYGARIDAEKVTDEQLAEWRQETQRVQAENGELYKALQAEHKALMESATRLYGAGSAAVKYLRKTGTPIPPHVSMHDLERRIGDARKAVAAQEREAKQAAETLALRDEAIAWLLARGKKIGDDFTSENAIQVANDIAAEEEIARLTAQDGYHDFSDQNCDGPCAGWDGESRRCDCGNRRVYWEVGYGHSFKRPYVHGAAW